MSDTGTPSAKAHTEINLDSVIIGGGIAGLWLLNKLTQQGRDCVLLERDTLGGGQTIASQGMIHGGLKYALGGALSSASEAIAEMPDHWQRCLKGEGEIDLRATEILSKEFFMWSRSGSLTSRLSTFFASKALRGRVEPLKKPQFPALFQHPDFKGRVYRLVDLVLDLPSLLTNLSQPVSGRIIQADALSARWQRDSAGKVSALYFDQLALTINAQHFIFCAGEANAALLAKLDIDTPAMQLRPLQQVIVKHRNQHRLYGHCVDLSAHASPRLTISSHSINAPNSDSRDDQMVWYIGGDLATENVDTPADKLIALAQLELKQQFPWLDFSTAQWSTLWINRAEPKQRQGLKPDNAYAALAQGADNVIVSWPTKLSLAPDLAQRVITLLKPEFSPAQPELLQQLAHFTTPAVAQPPWR